MATKLKEKEVDGKMQLCVSGDALIKRISDVCAKVEKAQDGYKSVMEDVYLIHKYKLYKESGLNFPDYMQAMTGMGKRTAHYLVSIWNNRLRAAKRLSEEFDQADVDKFTEWYDGLSMRDLIFITEKKQIDAICDKAINEGVLEPTPFLEDCKRDVNEKETDKPLIEDKAGETQENSADSNTEDCDPATNEIRVEISDEADIDELMDTFTGLIENGCRIRVTYHAI